MENKAVQMGVTAIAMPAKIVEMDNSEYAINTKGAVCCKNPAMFALNQALEVLGKCCFTLNKIINTVIEPRPTLPNAIWRGERSDPAIFIK
jgi:hypothetical protein